MATTVASRIVAAGETAGITRIHAAADSLNRNTAGVYGTVVCIGTIRVGDRVQLA